MGRFPLNVAINCRVHNFLNHILFYSEPDSLVSQALEYESSINIRTTITSYTNELTNALKNNGLAIDSITSLSKKDTKKELKQLYHTYWRSYINDCSKALSYKTYKSHIAFEKYLYLVPSRKNRRILSKLRLSDHCLEIEKGRQAPD